MAAAAKGEIAIGDTLGNYRVASLLGRGGMGAVYEGEHTILGRKAAIKVLLPEYSHNAESVERFFKEARATARLRHHAFVEVFDSGTLPDGSAYLVMEMLEGESLGSHLVRRGTLPVGEALTLAHHIAEGVGHAHRNGIVHRDLKPDNVFLARGLVVENPTGVALKVLDFGIAKLGGIGNESGSRTRTGTLMGTPLFMAPEQCRGAGRVVIDHRADVYALGCIVHAMISGQPPFPYEGLGEIIAAHLGEAPPPLGSLTQGVPKPIEALVLRLLAKDVDARPQSMDEVIGAIAQIAASLGIALVDLSALPVFTETRGATAVFSAVADTQIPIEVDVEPPPRRKDPTPPRSPKPTPRPQPVAPPLSQPFTDRPARHGSGGGRNDRVETAPMPPIAAGATEFLSPAAAKERRSNLKAISTLSSAAGSQSITIPGPRHNRRGLIMGLVGVAIAAGGFIGSRVISRDPTRIEGPRVEVPSEARGQLKAEVKDDTTFGAGSAPEREGRRPAVTVDLPADEPRTAPARPMPTALGGARPRPGDVRVKIASTPAGADVIDLQTGARLGATPYDARVPAQQRTVRYAIRKDGFHSRDINVKLDADADFDLLLGRKLGAAPPAPRPAPSRPVAPHRPVAPRPAAPVAPADDDDERRKL